ncbi:hypothetical protein BKA62DRAFT_681614 [Auriculariales sp. MPI-PUGE-AT-0066]|nr:hypothetical protein BKA62DRAFT_681614 [Auriculariales sp. MPI-PUGE-AT-0066]
MSGGGPRAVIQLVILGSRIVGKAFLEAGRQAAKNAQHRPQGAAGGDAAGVTNARSGSVTDRLTREHLMTLDEAHLILNTKRGDNVEKVLQHYEHLFKANAAPVVEVTPKPAAADGQAQAGKFFSARHQQTGPRYSSPYLQSKVVRAKERIEAELRIAEEEPVSEPPPPPAPTEPPAGGAS